MAESIFTSGLSVIILILTFLIGYIPSHHLVSIENPITQKKEVTKYGRIVIFLFVAALIFTVVQNSASRYYQKLNEKEHSDTLSAALERQSSQFVAEMAKSKKEVAQLLAVYNLEIVDSFDRKLVRTIKNSNINERILINNNPAAIVQLCASKALELTNVVSPNVPGGLFIYHYNFYACSYQTSSYNVSFTFESIGQLGHNRYQDYKSVNSIQYKTIVENVPAAFYHSSFSSSEPLVAGILKITARAFNIDGKLFEKTTYYKMRLPSGEYSEERDWFDKTYDSIFLNTKPFPRS